MTEDQFWKIIEGAGAESTEIEERRANLVASLCELSAKEQYEFGKIYFKKRAAADIEELCSALTTVELCGDDSWGDFCDHLVSLGKEIYESVVSDPESVVDNMHAREFGECYFYNTPKEAFAINQGIDYEAHDYYDLERQFKEAAGKG